MLKMAYYVFNKGFLLIREGLWYQNFEFIPEEKFQLTVLHVPLSSV